MDASIKLDNFEGDDEERDAELQKRKMAVRTRCFKYFKCLRLRNFGIACSFVKDREQFFQDWDDPTT